MKLEKIYDPKIREDKVYKFWQKTGYFNPDKLPKSYKLKAKNYCIVLPPPNITGELHMGHALNAIVQDILIRKKRMEGFKALWLPGIDHAGIAAQNVVEKELKKEGLSRFDLGREEFIKRMWQWKEKYGKVILDQFKKLGASCDWSRTRFTLDKDYSRVVKEVFSHYYKKGWIYRSKRVINWCPRCQTSLSDLELEYKKEKGKLWYIKYPLVKNSKFPALSSKYQTPNFIKVATTRPETMLGDTAIAVNPKDKRYKNLVGKKAILPLVNREIPIIADFLVDSKFGTGAVKITPAHDLKDYEISLRHKLPLYQVIDEEAKMAKDVSFPYQGLSIEEARQKIIEDLKKLNLLEKVEDYFYSIPKCDRCGTTVELIPSQQWFLRIAELAKLAEKPVKEGKIKFQPKNFEKGYFDWLKNIKDWCISRQIWWGHQLPIWFCQAGENSKSQTSNSELKKRYFLSLEKPKKCALCGKCQPRQSEDVLDTWFSSALWPFTTLGWPKQTRDLKNFYPTDFLTTARDIINLWVARMIFSALELTKKIPFKKVFIHPTVLTITGKRMSKSLGIGINPLNLVERYGADATRFGICWQLTGVQDIRFSEDHLIAGSRFSNKIWNAGRFVLIQIGKSKFGTRDLKQNLNSKFQIKDNQKILKALDKTIKSVNKDLENFRFGQALQKIYHFFWHNFCDKYIEKAKCKIQKAKTKKEKEDTIKTLLYVLLVSLKLLHPFLPFITEEIYQKLPLKNKKKSIMIENWPE